MFWADTIVKDLGGKQVINDSKTPSGRVHVGSLRGVVVHDLIYRAALDRGIEAEYCYGSDDYDPLDSVPPYLPRERYEPYLGQPICNIPAPDGSNQSYADYYMQEFIEAFNLADCFPAIYRLRDLYRSGKLNEPIRIILDQADRIRQIYLEESGSRKHQEWLPFHMICEKCGKIATTRAFSFDGSEIQYICETDNTGYVRGCGYQGSVSPFDGAGKLPWKLEWAARWVVLNVTIEGAGKDHSVAGGSREVAEAVCKQVFGHQPPINVPYEFLLLKSQKMSSSKGVGISAKEVLDVLPPEILRFLLTRTRPQSAIDFKLDGEAIPALFDDYDHNAGCYFDPENCSDKLSDRARIFELAQPQRDQAIRRRYLPRFSYVSTLVQTPGADLMAKLAEEKGSPLTHEDSIEIERRAGYARAWLKDFAPPDAKFEVSDSIPVQVNTLAQEQRLFLGALGDRLALTGSASGEEIHTQIHELAKERGLKASQAFQAVYVALLGRASGPRAGNLLAALDRDFVVRRLQRTRALAGS